MKFGLTILKFRKNTVNNRNMVMDVEVEIAAEVVSQNYHSKSGACRGIAIALPDP